MIHIHKKKEQRGGLMVNSATQGMIEDQQVSAIILEEGIADFRVSGLMEGTSKLEANEGSRAGAPSLSSPSLSPALDPKLRGH